MTETTSPPSADPANATRKKTSSRIVWIILGAIVVVWGTALIFFRPTLQANFWTWRLASADQPDHDRLVGSLVALGEPAIGPAIRLTRSDKAESRERGLEVLIGLVQRQVQERVERVMKTKSQGKVARAEFAEGPIRIDPRMAERFTELLDDPVPAVQAQAIEGVTAGHVEGAVDTLARLAIHTADPAVGSAATVAIDRVISGPAAEATLRKILAEAAAPDPRAQAIASLGMYPSAVTQRAIAAALSDDRRVQVQPESMLFDPQLAMQLAAQFDRLRGRAATQPQGKPQSQPGESGPAKPVTVGDYAARMLEMLTGRSLGILSNRPAAERAKIIEQYRAAVEGSTSRPD